MKGKTLVCTVGRVPYRPGPARTPAAAGIGALARTGGTPVGAECEIEQVLRVSVIVR